MKIDKWKNGSIDLKMEEVDFMYETIKLQTRFTKSISRITGKETKHKVFQLQLPVSLVLRCGWKKGTRIMPIYVSDDIIMLRKTNSQNRY